MPSNTEGGGARATPPTATCLAPLLLMACSSSTGPEGPICIAAAEQRGAVLRLSLTPGQICTLASADAEALDIVASSASAEYLLVIQSGSRLPASTTSLRFETRAEGVSASRVSTLVEPGGSVLDPARIDEERVSRAELRLRENARRALADARPLRAGPGATAAPGPEVRASRVAALAVGDTLVLRNTVDADLNVDCDGFHDITTVVRAMGSQFGILEDVEAAGAVTVAEYGQVLQSLQDLVYPVDTAYFGATADLDVNGVVWVLFTPVVNRVTPRGSVTRVSGFFNPSDLADPATCPASNMGEILYVLAADPGGKFSDPVPAAFATSRSVAVVAHELQHLIAAEQRVVLGGGTFADLEESWLSEGLAHTAETVVGLRAAEIPPGGNYGFDELAADTRLFDAYHFSNFRRAGYHLTDTNRTPALGDDMGRDPGGVSSLKMRGFSWLLLRWLADQHAPAGAGLLGGPREETIFRELTAGGPMRARGIANLERTAAAVGAPADWGSLIAAYALAPLADDLVGEVDPSTQLTSLDVRDVFAGLNREVGDQEPFESVFPLLLTEIALSETTNLGFDFDLKASTGRYFVLESAGPHPAIRLTLTSVGGGSLPASARARVILLRTR